MIKLFHSPEARSLRCLWLLEELAIPYELETMRFPPRINAPQFLDVHSLGTVPYLLDGKTAMNESAAILEYLVTRYGAGRFTVKPDDDSYGRCLNWVHFGESLTVALAYSLRFSMYTPKEEQPQTAAAAYFERSFADKVAYLKKALSGREYLCEDRFTIADISVGYTLYLCTYVGLAKQLSGPLLAYLERLTSRAAFRAALAKQQLPC